MYVFFFIIYGYFPREIQFATLPAFAMVVGYFCRALFNWILDGETSDYSSASGISLCLVSITSVCVYLSHKKSESVANDADQVCSLWLRRIGAIENGREIREQYNKYGVSDLSCRKRRIVFRYLSTLKYTCIQDVYL